MGLLLFFENLVWEFVCLHRSLSTLSQSHKFKSRCPTLTWSRSLETFKGWSWSPNLLKSRSRSNTNNEKSASQVVSQTRAAVCDTVTATLAVCLSNSPVTYFTQHNGGHMRIGYNRMFASSYEWRRLVKAYGVKAWCGWLERSCVC